MVEKVLSVAVEAKQDDKKQATLAIPKKKKRY